MSLPTDRGVVAFYRAYAQTGIHAATTAALTALGLLTFVHWGFALAGIAVYLLPPTYLYLGDRSPDDRGLELDAEADTAPDSGPAETDSESESTPDGDASDADESPSEPAEWRPVDVPTAGTLHGVTPTPDGPIAVGDGGVVVERRDGEWTRLLADGPAATGASLTDVAATEDGAAAWVTGDGGALGRYDVETQRFTDHSAPADRTDNLTAVAVAGDSGTETILVANGSGEVRRGRYDGRRVGWADALKPGSGSSVSALAFADEVGYSCDTSGSVFVTRDEGASWSRLGLDDAGCALVDLAPTGDARISVAATDGRLFEYDGSVWTPRRVLDGTLASVVLTTADGVACGPDGTLADRVDGTWERRLVATDADLHAVAIDSERAVVVGTDGTVLERERQNR